ncbi:MAG: AAA family ATPase [Phycisphaerae bacterium]|nr:AAA family ATPase [Phycisphaerae bacterium]
MLLREIKATNLLSFGPQSAPLELRPLNVLIGPNGSGKSNLLEAISLLRAAPTHLAAPVRDGGGIRDWIWKGTGTPGTTAVLEVTVENPAGKQPLHHAIWFTESSQKFELVDEQIESGAPDRSETPHFYYRFQQGHPILGVPGQQERRIRREDASRDESILSQRKDPDQYPEITYLGQVYARIRQYREWSFGRFTVPRQPQKADQTNDFLESDCGNLGLVLNRLRRDPGAKRNILDNLKQLYGGIEDYDVSVEGGTVQVFFHETGLVSPVPATRLSDGTLRYLCLLAVLCHPSPPPLICIEEPELGLHPDIIPTLARLLKAASERSQLVVTTHSDILIDEFSDQPESVVVCEKSEGQTTMKRLDGGALQEWLQKYRLGQLWTQGEIGGV